MNLYTSFCNYIKENDLINKGESLILGVSGGPDSLVMLDLFAHLSTDYNLDIVVFHLNHMFRKEASDEAEYVRKLAKDYGFSSVIESFDVPAYIKMKGLSPEEGARKARFNILSKISKKLAIKKVALAHNKDDQVETVFLNVIRGTGLKGLTGIDLKVGYEDFLLIHPLLFFSRKEIERYCLEQSLNPVRDPSNQESNYTRNKLRNNIIPYIEREINPAVKDLVYRMASNLAEEEAYIDNMAHEYFLRNIIEREQGRIALSLTFLKNESAVIRKRILKKAVESLQGHAMDLYAVHYDLFDNLVSAARTGKSLELKDDIKVRISYEKIVFEKSIVPEDQEFNYQLSVPDILKTESFLIKTEVIDKTPAWKEFATRALFCLCDFKKIKTPLLIRNRKQGDRFFPFGMNGSKKLKDFFIDQKIPREERDKIPIVLDANKRIIWVAGYRADDRFKVSDDTRKILKIGIKYTGGD
ncbi:MAG: tRNA lysidine(34) synthetase TilS [Halanaerobiaceae bacterium]